MAGEKESEMTSIYQLLNCEEAKGLEIEILFSSLEAMKENPSLEPLQAVSIGFSEWVK